LAAGNSDNIKNGVYVTAHLVILELGVKLHHAQVLHANMMGCASLMEVRTTARVKLAIMEFTVKALDVSPIHVRTRACAM